MSALTGPAKAVRAAVRDATATPRARRARSRRQARVTAPVSPERRSLERLRVEVTHQLAWRGLGEVEDVVEEVGALVLRVRTPHARKAAAEIPAAAKRADGVQPNKVDVRTAEQEG